MPNVERTDCRIVVDESSFDSRGIATPEIEAHLDSLIDTVEALRAEDRGAVSVAPMWEAVECLDECELYQFLSGEYVSGVDRDSLRRAYSMLSKCPEWDEQAVSGLETSVGIGDAEPALALSVAYALGMALQRRGIACLVFPAADRRGFLPVRGEGASADLFFFTDHAALPEFWRSLFSLEDVPEDGFFALGRRAFPRVVLHPDLSFRRFDGSYELLRDRVVALIGTLNDHFADEYQRCNGLPHEVQAALGRYQCDLSPESPKTRGGKQIRLRDVDYDGRTYRCEWHAKLEPHRNRIHFALLDGHHDGKLLIGIFVDHLTT